MRSLYQEGKVTYLVFGYEVGESGTEHLQGYLELSGRQRRRTVCKLPGLGRARLSARKGTPKQAADYCKKDGRCEEWGSINPAGGQGKRTDLDRVVEAINSNAHIREVALAHPTTFIKFHSGIKRYYDVVHIEHCEVRTGPYPRHLTIDQFDTLVLHGESGVGKTTLAFYLLPGALWVTHMDDLPKFDPREHTGIIFDDMAFKHLPRESQIHLVDYDHPRTIHIRYTTATIPAKTRKIFCCNYPGELFLDDPAIARRVLYKKVTF